MTRLANTLLSPKQFAAILAVAVVYYLVAIFQLGLATLPQITGTAVRVTGTMVWVPAGIALAALLLGGVRLWPSVALGTFLLDVHFFSVCGSGTRGTVLFASAVIAVGNTLEALVGRFLFLRCIGPHNAFQRSRDPLVFALLASVSSAAPAIIGATTITAMDLMPGHPTGQALLNWWAGDLAGILIITPLILAVRNMPSWLDYRRVLWGGVYLVSAMLATLLLFSAGLPPDAPRAYLIFPLVLIPALWGGPVLTQLSIAVMAATAWYGTMHFRGPFQFSSMQTNLLLAQVFACVLALAGTTLTSAMTERKLRERALSRMYRNLQVLTRCNAAVVHATDEHKLLQEVCRVAVETAGYRLACVGYSQNDAAKTIIPMAHAGPAELHLNRLRLSWGDNEYGRGAFGTAIRTGRLATAEDLPNNPAYQVWNDYVRESNFRSTAAVPLQAHGTVYGGLILCSSEPQVFGSGELELLAELGANLAHGILTLRTQKQREQAQAEVVRRNSELAALAKIFRTTTAEADLHPLLTESLRGALELTGLDGGTLCLVSSTGALKLSASINASEEMVSDLSTDEVKIGDCLCGNAARTGQPVIIPDNASSNSLATREAVRSEDIRFYAAFPLKSRQRVLGVLCVFSRTGYRPDQRRLDLLQDTCGPLALAIDNSMLYEQVHRYAAELEERVQQRTAQLQQEMVQREQVQASLLESERKYRELVEHANSIILRMDTCGRVIFLNEFGQRFFGYQEEELLGRSIIGTIVPETETGGRDLERLMQDTAAYPDRHMTNENENIRRDGTRAWISWTNRPIVGGDGRLVGCLSVGNDITALKQAEAQLEKAKEAAESADQLKSAFLATMSHELRTPLNSIIGFTGILLQGLPGPLNGEQRSQLGMVRSSARHLLALINDVLDISKIEAGQLAIQPSPFDLPLAIENVIQEVTPLAQDKHLRLVCDIAPDVREFNGDKRRVEQILLNLLSNAIKFTEHGQVALRCAREPGRIVVSVRDTGCGIADEDRPTLFRPFRQLDIGLSRKHEGTGLGLAICKRLVETMGGQIELFSQVGKGSLFTIRLPDPQPSGSMPGSSGRIYESADSDHRG